MGAGSFSFFLSHFWWEGVWGPASFKYLPLYLTLMSKPQREVPVKRVARSVARTVVAEGGFVVTCERGAAGDGGGEACHYFRCGSHLLLCSRFISVVGCLVF